MWHQIASQEFAGPLLSNLALEILGDDSYMVVSECRHGRADSRSSSVDKLTNILCGNGRASVITRAIVDPLPKLNTRNLCGRCVLHEMVQGNAAVSTEPCTSICEHGGDV